MNGDGIADLVGTDAQSNVWILPGRSGGSFGSALQLPTQLEAKDSILSATDINGDGLIDYVALTSAGLRILPGAAGTTLGAAQVLTAGAANIFGTVTADFNGDGIQDIASATEGGIVLLFGRTTGGLGSTTLIDTGKPVVNAIVGDFNDDGTDDALIQQSDGIQTFFGSASGGLSAGPSTPGVSVTYIGNAVGDFDGDGKLDAVSGKGGIQILYGSGDGRFSPGAVTAEVTSGIVSDLNGDGQSDLVGITGPTIDIASNYIYTLTSLMGSSSRTPTKVTTILPPVRRGNYSPLLAAVGDLNHDGHPDAALYEQNQQALEVWVGNGDGTFRAAGTVDTAAMQIKVGATTTTSFAGIGDLNGDGNADVVALGYQANAFTSISSWCIVVFYGDGSGGFSSTQILPITHPYSSLYLSDVNQDGKVDVVMTDGVLISVLINGGNKVFGGEQHYVAGTSFKTLSPGDFNGDHYPDLLAVNSSPLGPFGSNILTLLLNQPDPRHAVSGAIVASPATVAYNANFTLTASLSPTSSGGPAPSGTVQFSVDGVQVGTGSVQNGIATISVPGQTTQSIFYGLHTVAGVYSGDGYYPGAWISGALTVLKPDYPTSTVLTASPTTTLASDYVTLNAAVTAPAVVTSGVGTFYDGTSVLGQSKVSLTGSATLQTNLLSVGSHTLKAVYQGFFPVTSQVGNAIFEPSTSSAVAVTITAIPTAITVVSTSNSPSVAGTVVAVRAVATSSASTPNGSVIFFDGSKSLGTISLNNTGTALFNTSSLATGLHALSAVYNANGIFASSRAATTSITVTAAASTLHSSYVLFTGVATDRSASATIMTAMVGSLSGNPSGAVTLIEDGEIIGTGRIASSGLVTFHVDHIDSAAHAFYASYAGTDQYAPSSSRVALSTTYPGGPEFSLQWASSSPILALNSRSGDPSRTNVIQLQLNVDNGWRGAVSLSCPDSASEGYSCDFSPATMAGAGSSSLTIRPMTTVNYLHSYSVTMFALVFAVPCVCYRKRRMVVLACISLVTLLGCGLGKTPADTGTRVITVQAASGNIVHSIQVLAKETSTGQ